MASQGSEKFRKKLNLQLSDHTICHACYPTHNLTYSITQGTYSITQGTYSITQGSGKAVLYFMKRKLTIT